MNIYDGCVSNTITVYGLGKEQFIDKLEGMLDATYLTNPNYSVAIVDISHCITYGARLAIYDGQIPEIMQNYKGKWIKVDGKWIRQGLLGVCDTCHQEKELTVIYSRGNICSECDHQHQMWDLIASEE